MIPVQAGTAEQNQSDNTDIVSILQSPCTCMSIGNEPTLLPASMPDARFIEVFNVAICLVEGINNATQNKSTESTIVCSCSLLTDLIKSKRC